MSERDEKRERDENAGKIEDEIEALKAIYGDEMVREEEEDDDEEEEAPEEAPKDGCQTVK